LQIRCPELYILILLHLFEVKKKKKNKQKSELGIYNNKLNIKKSRENLHLEKPISFQKKFIKEYYTQAGLNC